MRMRETSLTSEYQKINDTWYLMVTNDINDKRNVRNEPVKTLRFITETGTHTIVYYVRHCTYTPEHVVFP